MYKKPIKQPTPIPYCPNHLREMEALCLDCKSLVCASCTLTLNSEHKSHSFMPLNESCKYVRRIMDESLKFNVLRREYVQERLLSLKQTRLEVELKTHELTQRIEETVQEIINALNRRKKEVFEFLQSKLESELQVLHTQENIWKQKEKIQNRIIELAHSADDNFLISNANFILEGLDNLKDKINLNSAKVYGDFEMNLKLIKLKEGNVGKSSLKNTNKTYMQNSSFFQRQAANKSTPSNKIENISDNSKKSIKSLDELVEDQETNNDKDVIKFHLDELYDTISNMFCFGEPFILEYRS
jgi:hypothetical protein